MSGTNTICVTTVLLETGMVPMREPVTELTLETPAGLIRVPGRVRNGKVRKVTFRNVPAFAVHLDKPIDVPHLGPVTVDVAYGGMFYVISEAAPSACGSSPDEGREIVRIGEMIKAAAQEQLPVEHPMQPGFAGVTIAVLSAPPTSPEPMPRTPSSSRPAGSTGTGRRHGPARSIDRPAARAPVPRWPSLHAKGKLGLNEDFHHEGILGTIFTGRLVEETSVGPYRAVVPTISGRAWITGFCNYVLEDDDPFPEGFTVGDIW